VQWNAILQSLTESDRESSTNSSPLDQVFCLSSLLRLHFSHHPNSLLRFSLSGFFFFFFLFRPTSPLSLCFLHNSFQTHPASRITKRCFSPASLSASVSPKDVRLSSASVRIAFYKFTDISEKYLTSNLLLLSFKIVPLALFVMPVNSYQCRPSHVYRRSRGNLFSCIRLYCGMLAR